MPDFPTPGQTDFDQGENVEPGQTEFSAAEEKAMRQGMTAQNTFRERFNANPEGAFAVMRPSTNVEDYRNEALPSKLTNDLSTLWDKSLLKGAVDKVSGTSPEPSAPLPETTDDPLAQELGYNSIPLVQKVIHRQLSGRG